MVSENICLGCGQLGTHRGKPFYYLQLLKQMDLLLCAVFPYQKIKNKKKLGLQKVLLYHELLLFRDRVCIAYAAIAYRR